MPTELLLEILMLIHCIKIYSSQRKYRFQCMENNGVSPCQVLNIFKKRSVIVKDLALAPIWWPITANQKTKNNKTKKKYNKK